MSIRVLILLTLFLLPIALLAGKAISLWYTPATLPARYDYHSEEFQIYGHDAAKLHGTYIRSHAPSPDHPHVPSLHQPHVPSLHQPHVPSPDQPHVPSLHQSGSRWRQRSQNFSLPDDRALSRQRDRPLALFVAARNLDRNWDSPSFAFQSGQWLAQFLGEQGIDSIRYDHRGRGRSAASAHSWGDFTLQAKDLQAIYRYSLEKSAGPFILLAHGSGCSLALKTALDYDFDVELFILLSCGHAGNLVEAWGNKLLFNMKRKGVKKEILEQASREWKEWLASSEIKSAEKAPPDLAAFRKALAHLNSKEMSSFLQSGRDIYLFQLISTVLLKKQKMLLHIVGELDEERPPADQENSRLFANELQKRLALRGAQQPYRFLQLEHCDHFLKYKEGHAVGLALTLERLNPFRGLNQNFLLQLQQALQ